MSLTYAELARSVAELEAALVGGRLENAWQVGTASVVLAVHAAGAKGHILVCADPRFARAHLIAERPAEGSEVGAFARSVRQVLRGRSLHAVALAENDRIVEFAFGRPEEPAGRLVAELTGRGSNVFLVGPTGSVVAALKPTRKSTRDLRPGAPYGRPAPPPPGLLSAEDRFAQAASYGAAIEQFYAAAEAEESLRSLRSALAAHLKSLRKKTERLLENVEGDRERGGDPERLRLLGELLKLHLADIPPRERLVTLPNDFAPGSPGVEVPLVPSLSPRANMERYFHRYKRAAASREAVAAKVVAARKRLAALDAADRSVEAAATLGELETLTEEWGLKRPGAERRRQGPARPKTHFEFTSADGLAILVGRSGAGNDEVTFHLAHGNDLWLHVEGYRGPHVVVRVPPGKTVPKETLLDAATLAVHFSELKRSGGGPVLYGQRKYVTKPRHAAPGQVLCTQSKTLHLTVERSRLDRLMGGRAGK